MRFADRIAVELQRRESIESLTFAQLRQMAETVSVWLTRRGIGKGERVAILAENDGRWCAAYLGIMRRGAVAVPLDTAYAAPQVAKIVADAGAVLLVASERFTQTAREAEQDVRVRHGVVPLASLFDITGGRAGDESSDGREGILQPCDRAVILYTSGTTADPKGVVLTHANLLGERTAAFQIVHVDERDAVLGVLPLFHALAQLANLLLPFTVGARVVFLETVNTTELTRALRERGITAFVVVPQFFYLLHQKIEHEIAALSLPMRALVRALAAVNIRLRRWTPLNAGRLLFGRIHRSLGPDLRLLITGGARFDPDTNRRLFALGFSIQQAYGLTECSGASNVTLPGDTQFDAVGPALPGIEVRIDPSASQGAERGDGEVLIRGPIVMEGYFNRPEQNAETLRDGWLHTGDLGYVDARGRLYITGRSKEVIVLGSGKNIYPEEIEAHYEKSPFIQELCVVGLSRPGEPAAERLHALVRPDAEVLRSKGIVNIRELMRFEIEGLSVQLPAHKRILGYDITLDPLPRTTTRKLKRFEIEKRLREGAFSREKGPQQPPAASSDAGAGGWAVERRVARVLAVMRDAMPPGAVLDPDAHLELDIGLDSMERVELFVHLCAAFGIEISDDAAQQIHTVRQVVDAVLSRAPVDADASTRVTPWAQLLEPRTGDELVAELAKRKRVRAFLLWLVLRVVWLFARVLVGLRVTGRDRLPREGAFLISPNHQSYLDAFLIVAALPARTLSNLFFVGAAEYFETPFRRSMARAFNVVPIDPDSNLTAAMQAGADGLRLGKVLVLFPEGERSIDGTVKAFRKGAAILSHHVQAPVVPVAIDGAYDLWARRRSINWRALLPWAGTRVRVAFGDALPPAPHSDYAAWTAVLRDRVIAMWNLLHADRGQS